MKKLESSKTTGGLYYNKFWEFIAIRNRFKKENKNKLAVNNNKREQRKGQEKLADDSNTPKSEES
ncbi:MAG: hypothetical protein CMP53_09085 [Flavobacteriales bacterium]|nr:hypothetical protein [Flavobacteriales bacterium]|tara:strand:- start:3568 stop:3762 length:195 start_codon:yes stop_codon:yes gene_type:complete